MSTTDVTPMSDAQAVQALAALLESTGQSDEFSRYMARADIKITQDAP